MFTNLIESNADKSAFKRRSSFLLITVAGYAFVLFAAGVAGVLTYDARVEAQNSDMSVLDWIPPVKPVTPDRPQGPRRVQPANSRVSQQPTRPILYESPDNPSKPPDTVSVAPNSIPPAPANAVEAPYVSDPAPTSSASGCETCSGTNNQTAIAEVPKPTPEPTPVKPLGPQRVSSTVLVSKIISLPKPSYPIIAKQMRTEGAVNVQILVDESGKVVSAHAVSGNPVLVTAAEEAARRARFTPTMLNSQPVKVQGVITYNFILQ